MSLNNPLLEETEQKIEQSLTPSNRQNYLKIVVAGMKIALNGGDKSILASLKQSHDPIHDSVEGALNLCLLMRKQSRGTMPMKAFAPAAMTLLLHALDFADKTGVAKIGQPELVQATKLFADAIFKKLGISKEMLHTAATKVHQLTQDPAAAAKLQQQAGGAS